MRNKGFALIPLIMIIVLISVLIYSTTIFVWGNIRYNTNSLYELQGIAAAQAGIMMAAYQTLQNGTYTSAEANLAGQEWYKYSYNGSLNPAGADNVYINAASSTQPLNTQISGWTIVNTSTDAASITSMQLSWIPTSNNLTSVTINGSVVWSGTSATGGTITIPATTVPASSTLSSNSLTFSGSMNNVNVYVTLFFSNNTAITRRVLASQTATLPDKGPWYPTGLQSWWKMNENTGSTVNDLINPNGSGAANNLTFGGAGTTWTSSGQFGSAVAFNGANTARLNGSTSASLTNSAFTFSAWIYLTSLPTSTTYGIVSRSNASPVTKGYEMYVNNNTDATVANRQKIIWAIGPNGTSNKAVSTSIPSIGTWIHVVGTYDGTNAKLYVNSVLNATIASSYTQNGTFYLGTRNNAANTYMNGRIDEAAFYNTALSAADILEIYTPNSASGTTPANITATGRVQLAVGNIKTRKTMVSGFVVSSGALKLNSYNESNTHL